MVGLRESKSNIRWDEKPSYHFEILPLIKLRVHPTPREQLRVAALLDDAAPVEHDDAIRAAHRAQPVGDDQRRPAAQELLHRFLYQALALTVQARRCLVENHDR